MFCSYSIVSHPVSFVPKTVVPANILSNRKEKKEDSRSLQVCAGLSTFIDWVDKKMGEQFEYSTTLLENEKIGKSPCPDGTLNLERITKDVYPGVRGTGHCQLCLGELLNLYFLCDTCEMSFNSFYVMCPDCHRQKKGQDKYEVPTSNESYGANDSALLSNTHLPNHIWSMHYRMFNKEEYNKYFKDVVKICREAQDECCNLPD